MCECRVERGREGGGATAPDGARRQPAISSSPQGHRRPSAHRRRARPRSPHNCRTCPTRPAPPQTPVSFPQQAETKTDFLMGHNKLESGVEALIALQRGPTGPTGPTGAEGPTGPTGPTGATGARRVGEKAAQGPRAVRPPAPTRLPTAPDTRPNP